MTAEQLAGAAGVALSLAFAYIPGVREKYDQLYPTQKALVMGIAIIGAAIIALAASCAELAQIGISCDQRGAWDLIGLVIQALVANQATYLIAVKPVKQYQADVEQGVVP